MSAVPPGTGLDAERRRDQPADRVVEADESLLDEVQHGDRRDRLADAGDPEPVGRLVAASDSASERTPSAAVCTISPSMLMANDAARRPLPMSAPEEVGVGRRPNR